MDAWKLLKRKAWPMLLVVLVLGLLLRALHMGVL